MLTPEVKEMLLYLFAKETDWEEKVLNAQSLSAVAYAMTVLLETRQEITHLQKTNKMEELQ